MTRAERITLVGGPADGEKFDGGGGDLIRWVPKTERELIMARTIGLTRPEEPILYRRSKRTRNLFVYQP